jgi:ribose 5-phosphate isomerase B
VIVLASDHGGFQLKNHIKLYLDSSSRECRDLGIETPEPVDYPVIARRLAEEVAGDPSLLGVLICGTGIGVSMVANRVPGVRAALCHDAYTAEMARRHNDANVLCLGGRVLGTGVAEQIVEMFVGTRFDGGRHARRVRLIDTLTTAT